MHLLQMFEEAVSKNHIDSYSLEFWLVSDKMRGSRSRYGFYFLCQFVFFPRKRNKRSALIWGVFDPISRLQCMRRVDPSVLAFSLSLRCPRFLRWSIQPNQIYTYLGEIDVSCTYRVYLTTEISLRILYPHHPHSLTHTYTQVI